jgi:ethanolamine utilization protein EutP (predicted NTPase)
MERKKRVESLCNKTIELLSERQEKEIKDIVSDFKRSLSEYNKQIKLTIAFIGQYSSGKSTIIAVLTGAKFNKKYYEGTGNEKKLIEVYRIASKELKIGVQITTDKTESYDWEKVLLIDTPGIYAGHPEHDDITLDQISKSDLLVFVIPNELFNPEAGNFFRRVANEMQRVGQMVLVVNKMSRETGTPKDLTKTILQVIEPYHPDDFYTCFIDANSYLKAQHEKDDEERQFLINESHLNDFVKSLQTLVEKNQLYARLVTPMHRAVDVIQQSLNILTTEDKTSRDLLEILRRKVIILQASKTRLQNSIRAELNKLEHEVIMLGEKVATKVDEKHTEEEINTAIKNAIKNAESEMQSLSNKARDEIQSLLENELTRLQTELEDLPQSPLGRSLAEQFEVHGVREKKIGEKTIGEKGEIPLILIKGPEMFAKLGSFSSTVSRDMVYNTVKFFGGKFKPWGAVKTTKFINKLGPILAGGGRILGIVLTLKEEKDRKKYEQELREYRAEIRQNFRQAASEMRSEFENGYEDENGTKYEGLNKSIFKDIYQQKLADVEKEQNEIRKVEESKREIVDELKNLLSNIKNEITSFAG